jgi:putative transposase
MKPLLPPGKPHPLGCHNPRVDDRKAMDAIFFVLRTGCQWGALDATGICNHSSAHRRFMEWMEAGVFQEFWRRGLLAYDEFVGIDWSWLAMDGAMTKAPLGGEDVGPNPTDRAKQGAKRSILTDAAGVPLGLAVADRGDSQHMDGALHTGAVERATSDRSRPSVIWQLTA